MPITFDKKSKIVETANLLGRSDQYHSNEVLFDSSERCFYSKTQHLSARNLWQGCQIVNSNVFFDRSAQYLCNEVLFDGSGRHFHGETQHPALKRHIKFT